MTGRGCPFKCTWCVYPQVFHGHKYRVNDIEFSDDGKYLATSSIDITLKLWDLNTGKILKSFEFSNDWVTRIAFLNNIIICGTYKGDIIIKDII